MGLTPEKSFKKNLTAVIQPADYLKMMLKRHWSRDTNPPIPQNISRKTQTTNWTKNNSLK
jgi:hypothetical protein